MFKNTRPQEKDHDPKNDLSPTQCYQYIHIHIHNPQELNLNVVGYLGGGGTPIEEKQRFS